ncbi:seryl-tRNA synthetase [Hathewaya proteolytica DSM 3090]|uniref:Serine--tRNA ligase n=1 Tax=Hathewaya proteolytica DSM 3090 TaxID=1121331 RepID=A0A1M6NYV6_9CLOT|nr:serine--tRNA ligase [Hathewaya proteolytica]SHK00812.1 seryl-tRNA synthetase [Hathewaya proteolytica DSM 3090]
MLDLKFLRQNPEVVKENIRKKFQDSKLPMVDEVISYDSEIREVIQKVEVLRAERNKLSKEVGKLMAQGKKDEAQIIKDKVTSAAEELQNLELKQNELQEEITKRMMVIPNIIDESVPIGKDDSENVEIQKYGEPKVPEYEIPYHADIMASYDGIDLDSARKVAGSGFYYLMGDIARLHSAVITYARDFMINKGFTYCIPPFMIRSSVVQGVMSFAEMDEMMYKIEGEDLYLIGTSEHSMIGKFIDTILTEDNLPQTLTSYSPCFRKEKGSHGIEERGVYRIHQFEKQEMIVICKPEESKQWFEKLWQNTVDLFRSLDIPVRTLECCSGDLADLKVKSIDVEAWSPRQKKYFEIGSCSNLGEAQARRLKIRVNGDNGKYFPHTLNNTVVAPPRMLIAFLENNLNEDGSVSIPAALRPYMGGIERIEKKNKK